MQQVGPSPLGVGEAEGPEARFLALPGLREVRERMRPHQPVEVGGRRLRRKQSAMLCKRCHIRKTRIEGGGPPDPAREAWGRLVDDLTR